MCSDWDYLPPHLLEIVLEKLAEEGGLRSLLPLRLVSKSWNATLQDYSRAGNFSVQGEADLARLIKIMPNFSSLAISMASGRNEVALSPLWGCKQLTDLQLRHADTNQRSEGTFNGLYYLPDSLKALSFDRAYAPPQSFANVRFTGVTKLEYLVARHRDGSTCIVSELLESLPNLRVRLLFSFHTVLESQVVPSLSISKHLRLGCSKGDKSLCRSCI